MRFWGVTQSSTQQANDVSTKEHRAAIAGPEGAPGQVTGATAVAWVGEDGWGQGTFDGLGTGPRLRSAAKDGGRLRSLGWGPTVGKGERLVHLEQGRDCDRRPSDEGDCGRLGGDRRLHIHSASAPAPLHHSLPPATVLTLSSDRSRPRHLAADRNRGPVLPHPPSRSLPQPHSPGQATAVAALRSP